MRVGPFVCAALIAWPLTARANKVLKTEAGVPVRWQAETIAVGLDRSAASKHLAPEAVAEALEAAMAAWNALPEMKTRFVAAPKDAVPATVVRFCVGLWKNPAGLLGQTRFHADAASGVITSAVVEINECDFRFLAPDEVGENRFDLQSVLTHELGHVLGLGHSGDTGAVMFSNTGSQRQRRPNVDDRGGVAALFGGARPAIAGAAPVTSAPRASRPAAPAPQAGRPAVDALATPAGIVSAVKIEQGDGEAVIYTFEPTILPAIDHVGVDGTPKRRRQGGPPPPRARARRR